MDFPQAETQSQHSQASASLALLHLDMGLVVGTNMPTVALMPLDRPLQS